MSTFKVGDRVRCTRTESFLMIRLNTCYTVSDLGSISNYADLEFIQLAELPGSAYKTNRFELCSPK